MTPLERILQALRECGANPVLSGNYWKCRCPAHEDSTPSLSIREDTPGGRIFVKCFAGCNYKDVLQRLNLTAKDLFPADERKSKEATSGRGLNVESLAAAKKLPVDFLRSLGVDTTLARKPADSSKKTMLQALTNSQTWACLKYIRQWQEVLIPYKYADGAAARPRRRMKITGTPKHCWAGSSKEAEIVPYGLDRLQIAKDKEYLILVEGETDCWSLWLHEFPALGVPGASMAKTLKREYFDGIERVYLVQEPDSGGETFIDAVRAKLSSWKTWKGELFVLKQPGGAKDVCDLRAREPEKFTAVMEELLAGADTVPLDRPDEIPPPTADEVEAILAERDISTIFDNAPVFARMSKAEFGKVKARLKDMFGRELNMSDFKAAVREAKIILHQKTLEEFCLYPTIMTTGRQLRDVVRDSLDALVSANDPPVLFSRSGSIAVLHRKDADDSSEVQMKSLCSSDTPTVKDHLTRTANFFRLGPDGENIPCNPPYDVAAVILSRSVYPFPILDGITRSPVMRSDGTILTEPGYDEISGLYHAPDSNLVMPDIPEYPTESDVGAAVDLLREMVCDFPFVEEASKDNLFALLLTIVMRPVIDGCVPLALIDAPRQGTGKGLLASLVSLVTTGGDPSILTAPSASNDDEWRKRITSTLMGGPGVVLLDNIDEPLQSPSFAAMLTAREWEDRILGVSENVRLPVRAVWFGTGNNIQAHGDMPRRCYHIRIDSNLAQPWRRDGFRHPNLREWVMENRGNLLAALLIIARAWINKGKPAWSGKPLGSFENWCRTVGGALENAGIITFLANTDSLYEQADEETAQWIAFFRAWDQTFSNKPVKVRELCSAILPERYGDRPSPLRAALPDDLVTAVDKGGGNLARRLGIALRERRDTVHGPYRLVNAGHDPHDKVLIWKVQMMSPEDDHTEGTEDIADLFSDFAGFAGNAKPKPAGKPANTTHCYERTKGASAGFAGFDPTSPIGKNNLSRNSECTNKYFKGEQDGNDPANPASSTQHIDNKDGYDCGFGCGSSFSNPADPANVLKSGHTPQSGESVSIPPDTFATVYKPDPSGCASTKRSAIQKSESSPNNPDEPYFETWIVE